MKLKLDLHTHCREATGYRDATVEIVGRILERIKIRELDAIAVTEHNDKAYGFRVQEIAEQAFGKGALIISGQEIDVSWHQQEVELYLPNGSTFRFLAHPGYPSNSYTVDKVQGIELNNYLHDTDINKAKVRQVAEQHSLLMLNNSDAHWLSDIGRYYNEISLEDLYARAV
jgi:PHP family Zn ribbon phosphoesterase